MHKLHSTSVNNPEARPRFTKVEAALPRKPSMAALLREGLQSLFQAPHTLREEFHILLRRI